MVFSVLIGVSSNGDKTVLSSNANVHYRTNKDKARELVATGKCPFTELVVLSQHGIKIKLRNKDVYVEPIVSHETLKPITKAKGKSAKIKA